jgi:hypothetical protein
MNAQPQAGASQGANRIGICSPTLLMTTALCLGAGLLAGCGPSLKSQDPQVRIRALDKVANPVVLARFALEDPEPQVRAEAVKQLGDQPLLEKVASEDSDGGIALQALGKVVDEAILDKLAGEPSKDPQDLWKVAREATSRVSDQATLAGLALTSPDDGVRGLAVNRLANQDMLLKVALESRDQQIAERATDKTKDPASLVRIALSKDSKAREAAIARVVDQAALKQIIGEDDDDSQSARISAASRLTDPDLLKDLAFNDRQMEVRQAAVGQINDQDTLTRVATRDDDPETRRAAVGKLTDPATLLRVVLEDSDHEVREAALEGLGARGDKTAIGDLREALPDWGVNAALVATLEKLGWHPASAAERVYLLISKQDKHGLDAQWEETKGVLLADLGSGEHRRVENAVYTLVCLGRDDVLPDLIRFLGESGTREMAETFLNSGRPELHQAGKEWAKANGYEIQHDEIPGGVGDAQTKWGNW